MARLGGGVGCRGGDCDGARLALPVSFATMSSALTVVALAATGSRAGGGVATRGGVAEDSRRSAPPASFVTTPALHDCTGTVPVPVLFAAASTAVIIEAMVVAERAFLRNTMVVRELK